MNSLLLFHYQKYPKMQLQDFVKLLYQQAFGPHHMHRIPTRDMVDKYLDQELPQVTTFHRFLEDIGNQYTRIYLDAIIDEHITKEQISELFTESMQMTLNLTQCHQVFEQGLQVLKALIDNRQLPFTTQEYRGFIEHYLKDGIRPLHHSDIYRDTYHPHYRVVHQSCYHNPIRRRSS